jgi:hypothetical protein
VIVGPIALTAEFWAILAESGHQELVDAVSADELRMAMPGRGHDPGHARLPTSDVTA